MKSKLLATLITSLFVTQVSAVQPTVPTEVPKQPFITPVKQVDFGPTVKFDERGLPATEAEVQEIWDTTQMYGAVNAYLWSVPQMAMYGSIKQSRFYGARGNNDIFVQYQDASVDGMLTPNRTVAYTLHYPNLEETGPFVYEYPEGTSVGLIFDVQMRWNEDMGMVSKHKGKATKYLLLREDQPLPQGLDESEYNIVRTQSNMPLFVYRTLDPSKEPNLPYELKAYPYSERSNPQENNFVQAKKGDEIYPIAQPKGMDYWKQLHELIQVERVLEADRFMLQQLKVVGIERGKPFNPTARQKKILEKAALIGEKMAFTISFTTTEDAPGIYRDDTTWVHPLTLEPTQHRDGDGYQFYQRVNWTYEGYGVSPVMQASKAGQGSTYLGAYRDASGQWFDGSKNYKLHIEPNAPAARFWDVSVYNIDTRALLPYKEGELSSINSASTKGIKKNPDGSIDIYFGPGKAPKGYESNFITTPEGVRWFTYFRLYGPTETYLDRSWKMNDIVEVK